LSQVITVVMSININIILLITNEAAEKTMNKRSEDTTGVKMKTKKEICCCSKNHEDDVINNDNYNSLMAMKQPLNYHDGPEG